MTLTASPETAVRSGVAEQSRHARMLSLLVGLWLILFAASLFSPPVLDDADGTHANAARQMALSGDWVTLRVNNVRYLEKAPLPYWIAAASFRLFGFNTFATHLPLALAVLLLMLLGYRWASEAFGSRAALYTGLGVLTSAGVFLFTRVFIPDVLLSFLLALALYCFLQALGLGGFKSRHTSQTDNLQLATRNSRYPYAMWTALALAVLTKGLVALVFVFGTGILYLAFTGDYRNWRALKPFAGTLLFLAIAAPWHILAGLRNTGGMNGHGFFWFYFINEHFLRFLGQRIPRDYNKLPGYLYWSLHLVWLFPWSLFVPLMFAQGSEPQQSSSTKRRNRRDPSPQKPNVRTFQTGFVISIVLDLLFGLFEGLVRRSPATGSHRIRPEKQTFATRTPLLVTLFSSLVLLFFSLSTNQEYYTFPAYLPILMLLAAALARTEQTSNLEPRTSNLWLTFAHASLTVLGGLIAAALSYGLWTARHLAAVPNVGDLLAHRGVGDYTLSMSSLFDLTGPSFAALRLPAALALAAFAFGPGLAWFLRARQRHLAATISIALTSATFLIAAHIALGRFAPMLSSQDFAARIQQLESTGQIARDNTLLLYGDQAYGSSIPFYLNRSLSHPALLVDGRSSSMLFGSTFADAQGLFLTPAELLAQWGAGPRKILFVPINHRDDVDRLLGSRAILLEETAGKVLLTDRPLDK